MPERTGSLVTSRWSMARTSTWVRKSWVTCTSTAMRTVAVGVALRNALLARPFPWSREFVTWRVTSAASRAHAEWLFSLRLAALGGASVESLLATVTERASAA